MNKKFILSGMLVCLLAFGLVLVGCGGDDGGGGSGSGGGVPTELKAKWVGTDGDFFKLTAASEYILFYSTQETETFNSVTVSGSTITAKLTAGGELIMELSFDYALNDAKNELTVSNPQGRRAPGVGVYTKQAL